MIVFRCILSPVIFAINFLVAFIFLLFVSIMYAGSCLARSKKIQEETLEEIGNVVAFVGKDMKRGTFFIWLVMEKNKQ